MATAIAAIAATPAATLIAAQCVEAAEAMGADCERSVSVRLTSAFHDHREVGALHGNFVRPVVTSLDRKRSDT